MRKLNDGTGNLWKIEIPRKYIRNLISDMVSSTTTSTATTNEASNVEMTDMAADGMFNMVNVADMIEVSDNNTNLMEAMTIVQ